MQIGEVIGKESTLNPVDAQVKPVSIGGRRDGVGARLLLAPGVNGHRGDELPGDEGETLQFVDDEVEVITLGHFRDAELAFETRRINLTFQASTPRQKR